MNSVSMPFFANFFGSGSFGSVAATSILLLTAERGRPNWERMLRISYFASTLFKLSACVAAAAGAANLDVLKATGKTHGEAMLAMKGLGDKPHAFAVTVNPAVNLIDVELSLTVESLLPAGIWGQNPIRVRSRAEAYGQSKLCVLGLDKAKADTIKEARWRERDRTAMRCAG